MIFALRCRYSFSSDQRNASLIAGVSASVIKMLEYDFAWTDSINAMLVSTASSCSEVASGNSETAPTVPWMVSNSVRPVNTRMVACFSSSVRVFQLGMSLDTGIFSGSQKLPVRRSHTSRSLSSGTLFQLIAFTGVSCDSKKRA